MSVIRRFIDGSLSNSGVTNCEYQQQKVAFTSESDLRSVWLPEPDVYRTFFASLSDEIADTIAAMQGVMAA